MHSEAAVVLKNFANVTGKHMKAFRPATLLKRDRCPTQVFPSEICEIVKDTEEHL